MNNSHGTLSDLYISEQQVLKNRKQLKKITTTKNYKTMKKVTIILAGVLMSIVSLNAFADGGGGKTANADANASARIITPLQLTKSTNLIFGNIASSIVEGTVTIEPSGARSHSGGVTPSVVGDFKSATYAATGEQNATYNITLPESVIISSGTNSMTVEEFISTPANGTFGEDGTQEIKVGATLNVAGGQLTGNYTGTYNVTIAYN